MNKEEIQEAIKIIKEPITVNCIEYKYFDQENYDKLTSVYDNCRWFIDNVEQIIQNVNDSEEKIKRMQNLIDKTRNYYLKTLNKNKTMPDEAVEMYNLLDGNKR